MPAAFLCATLAYIAFKGLAAAFLRSLLPASVRRFL